MILSTTVRTCGQTQSSYRPYVHTPLSVLAVAAGIILLAASATTNAAYGWQKSDFLPQQITWAAVSVAASIVLALCPTAILNALRSRSIAAGALALLAMSLTGTYSFTAAIGASAGQRITAQSEADASHATRGRHQSDYDSATSELAALAAARPASEVRAIIDSTMKANPGARCDLKPGDREYGGVSRKVCPDVAALEAVAARAQKRDELQSRVAKASAALNSMEKEKPANSDAGALAAYLAMAGMIVSLDALNHWLALLPVALIELGPGLSLALVPMLKAERVVGVPSAQERAEGASDGADVEQTATVPEQAEAAEPDFIELAKRATGGTLPVPKLTVADNLPGRMVALVKSHGTELMGSNRTFARALGCSHTQAARVLDELSAVGAVVLTKGKAGTVVRLARAA